MPGESVISRTESALDGLVYKKAYTPDIAANSPCNVSLVSQKLSDWKMWRKVGTKSEFHTSWGV